MTRPTSPSPSTGPVSCRALLLAAAVAVAVTASPSRTEAQAADLTPPTDARLAELIGEALERLPEVLRSDELTAAELETVPQAGALPDPWLTLGIVNDGFDAIRIGEMETSSYQAMVSQAFPWPGKRALRTAVAERSADIVQASARRARLSAEADVRRAYFELVLARDRLSLLAREETLWRQGEGIARLRYEVGEAPQADLIRSQLESSRIRQRRTTLEAELRSREQELARLLGRPPGEPVDTPWHVTDVRLPGLPVMPELLEDAEARSPELLAARFAVERGERLVDLARRERFPDMSVGGGIMPRGDLDPMWTASFGIGIPAWARRKQARAVAEAALRRQAESYGAQAIREIVLLRARQRHELLAAALERCRLYASGLLVQSEGALESTMAQYRVGRVPFTSVLEMIRGNIADRGEQIEAIADAQRLAIAQWELALAPPVSGGGMPAGSAPSVASASGSSEPAAGAGDGM